MVYVNAHFDGTVFVSDEPVDVPPDVSVRLAVLPDDRGLTLANLADIAATFPSVPDWPKNSAAQVDHYLYGTPKNST